MTVNQTMQLAEQDEGAKNPLVDPSLKTASQEESEDKAEISEVDSVPSDRKNEPDVSSEEADAIIEKPEQQEEAPSVDVIADEKPVEAQEKEGDKEGGKVEEPSKSLIFAKKLPAYSTDPEFEEVIIDISELKDDDEYSEEMRNEWENRYAETMKVFQSRELVIGKIVAISESGVAVDIGFKSEGTISFEEFTNPNSLKIGDEIEVCIDRIEDREGALVLSKKKAEFYRVWEKINNLYQTSKMVEAQIVRRIKGGMVVDLFGVEAFLPGSQIDVHPVRDFDALVGITMDFRIIKVNNARKNVVLSHKVLVEESLKEIREKVLSELEEGQVVEGVVKNITDFGVFVDLGGVDGLLHITDLSWGRVSHPSDVVSLDEKITVKVLNYDKEKRRISLGLKQLKEHHWDNIEEKYPVGEKVKGKVVSIVKYGAFVELEEGIEGLVHISEMSWTQHIKHPSQIINVNDEIEIVILNIDRESRKISLGMKQVEEDPWERLEGIFKLGTKHKGVVRDLVPFGAFVELEPGIDGLIHISDLSWTRKVRHPGEIIKKNQEIEVIILNFDKNERRIALGFKQLEEDPWDDFEKAYPIRAKSEGSVIRVLEKGVVVMLPLGVEGFIPNSQLGKSLANENKKKIKEGDNLELEVIEFDKANHRIVLSHSNVERGKEKSNFRAFRETTEESKTTIGDILRSSGQVPEVKKPGKLKKEKDAEKKAGKEPQEAETAAEETSLDEIAETGEPKTEDTSDAASAEAPEVPEDKLFEAEAAVKTQEVAVEIPAVDTAETAEKPAVAEETATDAEVDAKTEVKVDDVKHKTDAEQAALKDEPSKPVPDVKAESAEEQPKTEEADTEAASAEAPVAPEETPVEAEAAVNTQEVAVEIPAVDTAETAEKPAVAEETATDAEVDAKTEVKVDDVKHKTDAEQAAEKDEPSKPVPDVKAESAEEQPKTEEADTEAAAVSEPVVKTEVADDKAQAAEEETEKEKSDKAKKKNKPSKPPRRTPKKADVKAETAEKAENTSDGRTDRAGDEEKTAG